MLDTYSAHKAQDFCNAQLELFGVRCGELAARALAGQIAFLDAVDMCAEAALWSGLADNVGPDIVQLVMANAFADARKVLA